MSLRDRLGTGFRLAGGSLAVLRANPGLSVYPLLGGLATVAYIVTVFGGFVALGGSESLALVLALLVGAYAGSIFLVSFSIAALVWASRETFAGRTPSVRDAFRAAAGHTPALLVWAILSAFVGLALQLLEESSDIVGTILSALLNTGWLALTYFVIPVVVLEDVGPTAMVQESGRLIRDTWGETLGSEFGVGFVTALLLVPGLVVGVALYVVVPGDSALLVALLGGGLLASLGLLAGYTLGAIAKTALYVFARSGTVPGEFDESVFAAAAAPSGPEVDRR
ncbi:hypothetical protein C479_09413 [Halovivax asiaticus JCM 14624]|uniref:Glycerophosphoryl diester phosphodiesterase membrane domain-containing protein n=1 Tax=Halovivax asiaticus JCM 14624 TaxID=1227490 RepID=M0BL53_9EURY|nr:DUF6159 family protein [Halovivax asiaticus]ELZ11018.1 hypothetical protein C479_09413 [Halovivax asiaticus JCM 14624]